MPNPKQCTLTAFKAYVPFWITANKLQWWVSKLKLNNYVN